MCACTADRNNINIYRYVICIMHNIYNVSAYIYMYVYSKREGNNKVHVVVVVVVVRVQFFCS